jgi:hypothetical protein
MKKQSKKNSAGTKSRTSGNSKYLVAATALAVPMLSSPAPSRAQLKPEGVASQNSKAVVKNATQAQYVKFSDRFLKDKNSYFIAGVEGTHPVYRTTAGKYFFIEPATGDMKFLSPEGFQKFQLQSGGKTLLKNAGNTQVRFDDTWLKYHKESGVIKIVGVDAKGNVIQKNSQGQNFYLNAETGDMVIVK